VVQATVLDEADLHSCKTLLISLPLFICKDMKKKEHPFSVPFEEIGIRT